MRLWEEGSKYINTPYEWGGNDINRAVDCSGFVCAILRKFKIIGKKDFSAQMLFNEIKNTMYTRPAEDDLIFFGKQYTEITHIAIAINETLMIEAGGEGRISTDKGKVRIRRIDSRNDFLCSLKILYQSKQPELNL